MMAAATNRATQTLLSTYEKNKEKKNDNDNDNDSNNKKKNYHPTTTAAAAPFPPPLLSNNQQLRNNNNMRGGRRSSGCGNGNDDVVDDETHYNNNVQQQQQHQHQVVLLLETLLLSNVDNNNESEEKEKQKQEEEQQQQEQLLGSSSLDVGILSSTTTSSSTTMVSSSSYDDYDYFAVAGPSYYHELRLFENDDPFDTTTNTNTQSIRQQQRYLNPDDSDNCFYQDGFTFDFDYKTGRKECKFLSSCKLFDGYCEEIDNSDEQPCVTISQLYVFENTEEDVTSPSGVCQNFTKPYEQSICTIIKEKIEVVEDDDIIITSDSSSSSDDEEDVSNKECELYFDNEKCSSCEITSKVPGLATYCINFDCTNTPLEAKGQTEMNGFAIMPILQSSKIQNKAMCTFDFLTSANNNNNSLPLFHFDEQPRCPYSIEKVSTKEGEGLLDPVYRGLIGLLVGFAVWLLLTILVCMFWKPMPPISAFKNLLLKPPSSKSKSSKTKKNKNNKSHHQQVDDPNNNNIDTENHSTTDEDESNIQVVSLPVVDAHQL